MLAGASTASVFIGFLLFLGAPQAQDLFLEVKADVVTALAFWAFFYLAVMLMWALPVYVSSRWILTRFENVHARGEPIPVWVRRTIPSLLVVLCFGAVLVGQLSALWNAPALVDENAELRIALAYQGQQAADGIWREAVELLATAGVAAAYSATGRVFFSIYAVIIGVIVWGLLRRPARKIPFRIGSVLWWLVTVVILLPIVVAAMFVFVGFSREQSQISLSLAHLAVLPLVTLGLAYLAWQGLKARRDGASFFGRRLLRLGWKLEDAKADETTAGTKLNQPVFYALFVVTGALILCAVFLHPLLIAEQVSRAHILPVLLGLPIAAFTYIGAWSARLRAPLVIASVLLIAFFASFFSGANDIRTVADAPKRQDFNAAVSQWAAVHNCDPDDKTGTKVCPAPVIIAAAGGASRASFLLAGLVGKLLDEETVTRASPHQTVVETASFSPDGFHAITSSSDLTQLWDGIDGSLTKTLSRGPLTGQPQFSPDSKRMILITSEHGLSLWDPNFGSIKKQVIPSLETAVFNTDATRIVTTGSTEERNAFLFDGVTGDLIAALGKQIDNAVFSPDGKRLFVSSESESQASLWNTATGAIITNFTSSKPSTMKGFFSPDSARLVAIYRDAPNASFSEGAKAALWDATHGAAIAALQGKTSEEPKPYFSPDAKRFVLALGKETALFDASNGQVLGGNDRIGELESAAFSSDSARFISIMPESRVTRLWDAATGALLISFEKDKVDRAVFSPDGARLVTYSEAYTEVGAAHLRSAQDGSIIAKLEGITGAVRTPLFNRDGTRLATADLADGAARLWDGLTGAFIAKLPTRDRGPWDIVFSPDGGRIAGNDEDRNVRLWDAQTGAEIGIVNVHRDAVELHFSADGKRMISRSARSGSAIFTDKVPHLWDVATGEIIDKLDANYTRKLRPFGKQLFALSGVSGGALGSAFIYAAMADGQTRRADANSPFLPPCLAGVKDPLWFQSAIKYAKPLSPKMPEGAATRKEPHESWQSCLELINAGDFLSPVFVAMTANDPFGINIRGDRAAILEEAWETRYAKITGQNARLGPVRKADSDEKRPGSTLAETLSTVRNRVLDAAPGNWMPILILNGTSVATGRRIVATDVETINFTRRGDLKRLYRDAYDLHELLREAGKAKLAKSTSPVNSAKPAEPVEPPPPPVCPNCDIRLSTAALVSARFPVISPHGGIRNAAGETIDHVVDGGYFENFGATSALEMVAALEQRGLEPFVILVNNEPTLSGIDCIRVDKRMDFPSDSRESLFSVIGSPLRALMATRQARGTNAAVELCTRLGEKRFAFITVAGEKDNPDKPLSMSWWLSMNVQKYLHDQLRFGANPDNDAAFLKIDEARRLL